MFRTLRAVKVKLRRFVISGQVLLVPGCRAASSRGEITSKITRHPPQTSIVYVPTTIKGLLIFFTTLADKDNLSLRVIWQLPRPFNEGAEAEWFLGSSLLVSCRVWGNWAPVAFPASSRFLLKPCFLWDTDEYLRILAKSPLETVLGFLTRGWCFKLSLLTEQSVSFSTHQFYSRILVGVMVHPKFGSELLTNSHWGTLPMS